MREILKDLIPDVLNYNEDFQESIDRKYNSYIAYSQIPYRCLDFKDQKIIPSKLQAVFANIDQAVSGRYNLLITFADYKNLDYLAYLMLQAYFKSGIVNNEIIEDVIYADTKLLMEDYKRLIDFQGDKDSLKPVHDLKVLYEGIEKAPMIIWNKLTMLDSKYEKDKLYDILSIRQRKGLGNIFFTVGGLTKIAECLGKDLCSVIDYDVGFDCMRYNVTIEKTKEAEIFKWSI